MKFKFQNVHFSFIFRVQEELEALEAILMDDISISRNDEWVFLYLNNTKLCCPFYVSEVVQN